MGDQVVSRLPDWIFFGETARIELLNWMLPDVPATDYGAKPIWVEYGQSSVIHRTQDGWQAQSSLLFPGMTVLMASSLEQAVAAGRKQGTRIGILEDFPFGRQSTGRLLWEVQQQYPAHGVLVVLLDLPQRCASTDLIPPQELLEQRYQFYQKENNVQILQRADQLPNLFYWREDILQGQYRRAMKEVSEMESLIDTIQYDYELLEWELQQQLLTPGKLERICSFSTARNEVSESLWQAYQKKAEELLFPSWNTGELVKLINDLYRSVLRVLEPEFWNLKKDCECLTDQLRRAYNEWMNLSKWLYLRVDPMTEERYEKLVEESGINAAFYDRLTTYVSQEALRVLKNYLQDRCKKIKEILQ